VVWFLGGLHEVGEFCPPPMYKEWGVRSCFANRVSGAGASEMPMFAGDRKTGA
jgi:hypothetical protein